VLRVVHHWRDVTWNVQDAACVDRTPYEWRADRHSSSLADRWRIARLWYERSQRAYSPSCQPAYSSGVPAWFVSIAACLSVHEEYGLDGPNTSAGLLGFIYPPSSYQEPGPSLAAQYGDSWLNIPVGGQLAMAWSLYSSYGGSPWSTWGMCA
jgi:hypothetical protein